MARTKLISDEAVLEAASRVMAQRGPSDFTLGDVAAAAGIAAATLVQRFGTKQGLVARAVAHDNRRFAALLDSAPRAVGADALIDLFWTLTPGDDDEATLADQLLWLRQDIGDPELNGLARARLRLLREAVAARLPLMGVAPDLAARLVEAQWQGALTQWAIEPRGRLADFVAESLAAWLDLAVRD
jgi:AcrR family transcriptional regulator